MEFESVYFWGEGKPKYTEKTSRSKDENQQQTRPTYGVDAGFWTRATMMWEASALTTAPPLAVIRGFKVQRRDGNKNVA